MELPLEEEVGKLQFEFIQMSLFRQGLGKRQNNPPKIDLVNDALIDIQQEHKNLTGHYFAPSKMDYKNAG